MKKNNSNLLIILFFVIILILICCQTLLAEFSPYDEIWCFNNTYKMYNGGTIYQNNNVIDTPIFFILGNFLFSILGANLFTFRIYNVFIYGLEYILLFRIFRKLGSSRILSFLYLTCWLVLGSTYISCGANYNTLGIMLVLAGILFHLRSSEKKYYHFVQGILIFIVFFIKQTIGVYYAFGIVLFELLEIGFKKQFWVNQFKKLSTFLPCLIIACFAMFYKGNLFDFINLCFGSVLEFGSSNHSFNWKSIPTLSFLVLTIVFSIYIMKKQILSETQKRTIKFLLCMAIALSFNMFPLANQYHINLALLFYFLLFVHILDLLFIREIFTSKTHVKILLSICFCIFSLLFIRLGYQYFSDIRQMTNFDTNHPFYNAPIRQENLERINTITNYISLKRETGTNVLVLSYEASAFMVPLNLNNNEFDLLFAGNLGYNGIPKTMDKIATMKNTEFLLFTNEDDCFYQESKEIRDYILSHFKKTGELLNYSIYINE